MRRSRVLPSRSCPRDSSVAQATGRPRGFTLLELLVTVAIISIVSLIAIPNLFYSLHHAKQKRTMASIRSLALAVEKYSIDLNRYPLQPSCGKAGDNASIKAYTRGNKKKKPLDPSDESETKFSDGWGYPIRYHSEDSVSYTLCSGGRDGSDCCTPDAPPGAISDFDQDLVYSLGSFVTYPVGQQE